MADHSSEIRGLCFMTEPMLQNLSVFECKNYGYKGATAKDESVHITRAVAKSNGIFIPFCLLGHFINHKHLISEECDIIFKKGDSNMHQK